MSKCPIVVLCLLGLDNRKPVLVMMNELTENRGQSVSLKRWMPDVICALPRPYVNPDVSL